MAEAIPPTSPTMVREKMGTAQAPPDNLGGSTINVGGGPGDLQAAINASAQGDTIVVPAGAVYDQVTLPIRTGNGWTAIRVATPPPVGTKVSPADTAKLFKIAAPNGLVSLDIPQGTQGWRFIGLHSKPADGAFRFTNVRCGGERISFERSVIEPHTSGRDCNQGLYIYGSDTQIWDSWIETRSVQQDNQAIWMRSEFQVPSARLHVENTTLRGAGMCFMASDEANSLPAYDMTFLRCHMHKPLSWMLRLPSGAANPEWDGVVWSTKNIFELKFSERVLLDACVLENSWAADSGGYQNGEAFVLNNGVSNSGGNLHSLDTMFRNSTIINVDRFATTNARGAPGGGVPTRTAFLNNIGRGVRGAFIFANWMATDLWLEGNTLTPMLGSAHDIYGAGIELQTKGPGSHPRLTIKKNIYGWVRPDGASMSLLVNGNGQGHMTNALLDTYFPDRSFSDNHQYNRNPAAPAINGVTFHADYSTVPVPTPVPTPEPIPMPEPEPVPEPVPVPEPTSAYVAALEESAVKYHNLTVEQVRRALGG